MPMAPATTPFVTLLSKSTIYPDKPSTLPDLPLSVSDLPMLSCHYIQKGLLFTLPPNSPFSNSSTLIPLLKLSLSKTLSHFPPLAGQLITDPSGHVLLTCNDSGAEFIHARALTLSIRDILSPLHVPSCVKSFFALDRTVSYNGHFNPILVVQVTELADGVFIGCAVNHAVIDGTSLWNFFNSFAEITRGVDDDDNNNNNNNNNNNITRVPNFSRDNLLGTKAVLSFPPGGPRVTFDEFAPLSERIFCFSREAIRHLKSIVNYKNVDSNDDLYDAVELMGKQKNDRPCFQKFPEISSFQSLCALLWRAITSARKLPPTKKTTFRMAVNVRHRLTPKMDSLYFGNAIQSIPTYASAGDVTSRDLPWCARELNKSVVAHDDKRVHGFVKEWEGNPRLFPLGNLDGASITMGSSPRFPMYDNDFGWGRPVAVRSGGANKFDGKISAYPGREGGGSVDLEVVLDPGTMAGVECDSEFMQFVSLN